MLIDKENRVVCQWCHAKYAEVGLPLRGGAEPGVLTVCPMCARAVGLYLLREAAALVVGRERANAEYSAMVKKHGIKVPRIECDCPGCQCATKHKDEKAAAQAYFDMQFKQSKKKLLKKKKGG